MYLNEGKPEGIYIWENVCTETWMLFLFIEVDQYLCIYQSPRFLEVWTYPTEPKVGEIINTNYPVRELE